MLLALRAHLICQIGIPVILRIAEQATLSILRAKKAISWKKKHPVRLPL